jgi:UDP-glucose 4-epimerase
VTTVAVTGISGYLGGALLDLLGADTEVQRVIGIDVLEPGARPEKLTFHRLDVRDPDIAAAMDGADTVVHLAFVVGDIRDESLLRDVNVGGLLNVLSAMDKVGATHLVYPSSAHAYGAHADNDRPLTEESPLRPNPGSVFGGLKAACEAEVNAWQARNEAVSAAILRLAPVFGPHVGDFHSRVLESPVLLGVRGHAPPLQALHEDDAAAALHFALARRLSGLYNVCSDEELSRPEVLSLIGKREIPLPERALVAMVGGLHALGLVDIVPAEVPYHVHPWAMSNAKLRQEGWVPRFSTRQAVAETVLANADFVSIGSLRATRQQWTRILLVGGVVGVLGAAGAGLALRLVLRRWSAPRFPGSERRRGGGCPKEGGGRRFG